MGGMVFSAMPPTFFRGGRPLDLRSAPDNKCELQGDFMRRFLSVLVGTSFLLTPTLSIADNAGIAPPAVTPPPVEAEHGMVVSSQHYASQVGADVLKAGGNAVDAAVEVV
jgi:hypothetical protein